MHSPRRKLFKIFNFSKFDVVVLVFSKKMSFEGWRGCQLSSKFIFGILRNFSFLVHNRYLLFQNFKNDPFFFQKLIRRNGLSGVNTVDRTGLVNSRKKSLLCLVTKLPRSLNIAFTGSTFPFFNVG